MCANHGLAVDGHSTCTIRIACGASAASLYVYPSKGLLPTIDGICMDPLHSICGKDPATYASASVDV